MAWLYEQKGKSRNWYIGYRVNGKLHSQTTGTADRDEAEKELGKVRMLFEAHRTKSLTEKLYEALTGGGLPKVTLVIELDGWLAEAKHQTAPSTLSRYKSVVDEFKTFLNATETGPMLADVATADVAKFLVAKRDSTAASTVNVTRKILSGFFKRSIDGGRLRTNPVSAVKRFKAQKGEKVKRRSFTMEELKNIYDKAPDDFWRYMIVGGFYTGLRMGDLICLKWGNVDLQKNFIVIEPDKTEETEIRIPIATPLRDILLNLRAEAGKVKPSEYLWPEQAHRHQTYKSGSGYFSNQFYSKILSPLGLVPERAKSHKAKVGSTGKRTVNEISFHCLRHSFISSLKSKSATQAVAKALAGHSSDAVNDLYTHVPDADKIAAINLLPEFVK